jgi:tryptophanyl-tRNA synthetase
MNPQPSLIGKRVLTGIKPTGTPHLGNLVGAIRPIITMSETAKETIVFIADLHALNAVNDPKALAQSTREIAATFLALGLNPEKAIFFRQSDVPELYLFNTLMTNVTAKGLLNRAHAYKDKVQKNTDEGRDGDDGVNMGLFTYPLLMASDILLYNADLVPVGKDQKQHIEIARDIASSWNHHFGKGKHAIKVPEPVIEEQVEAIPGVDGRKMSKSYGNVIPLFGSASELKKAVMAIKTDSRLPEEPKEPDEILVYQIYKIFATAEQTQEMAERFRAGGLGYGDAKKMLLALLEAQLAEPRQRYESYLANPAWLDKVLEYGAQKARQMAQANLNMIAESMLGRTLAVTDAPDSKATLAFPALAA